MRILDTLSYSWQSHQRYKQDATLYSQDNLIVICSLAKIDIKLWQCQFKLIRVTIHTSTLAKEVDRRTMSINKKIQRKLNIQVEIGIYLDFAVFQCSHYVVKETLVIYTVNLKYCMSWAQVSVIFYTSPFQLSDIRAKSL